MRIGLISDTHDLVRPEALAFLRGCDHIVHAGDICGPAVLEALAAIAPVTAVRGNNDLGAWADRLQERETLVLGGVPILVLHDVAGLARRPAPADVRVVVFGHSHKPAVDDRGGVLHVNPGSAGPRRFTLPISIGELVFDGGAVSARTVALAPGRA